MADIAVSLNVGGLVGRCVPSHVLIAERPLKRLDRHAQQRQHAGGCVTVNQHGQLNLRIMRLQGAGRGSLAAQRRQSGCRNAGAQMIKVRRDRDCSALGLGCRLSAATPPTVQKVAPAMAQARQPLKPA